MDNITDSSGATMTTNKYGDKFWKLDGKLHRLDGPAVIQTNGYKEWWQHYKRHRTDGPAKIYEYGHKEYYINNNKIPEEDHKHFSSK